MAIEDIKDLAERVPRNPAEKPCCNEMRRRLTSGLGQV